MSAGGVIVVAVVMLKRVCLGGNVWIFRACLHLEFMLLRRFRE